MFTSFARREQRFNGGLYLRGLMLDGRRKSMVPMAERLGVDHQRLQQFITSSTWNYTLVRRRLAERAITLVAGEADDALAADSDEAGRIAQRRRRCQIPDHERHRPKWQLAEWPPGESEPTDYWLSTLPADVRLRDLVRLAKIRWRIEHDYRDLKTGLGLTHFEGRSFTGWHRHVTLVSAAHLFLTELRLTSPKAAGAARPSTRSSTCSRSCWRPGQADAPPVTDDHHDDLTKYY